MCPLLVPRKDWGQELSGIDWENEVTDEDRGQELGSIDWENEVTEEDRGQELGGIEEDSVSNPTNHQDQLHLYDMSVYSDNINTDILERPLFDGAQVTVLDAIVKNLSWFCEHPTISKEALSDSLLMQHQEILPPGNHLPGSYVAARNLVEPYLVQLIEFHACPNDCVIFRGENTDKEECPTCGAKQFVKHGIPAKRFYYLLLGPRLQRLFETPNLAQIIQCHSQRDCDGVMIDVYDAPAWKEAYSPTGVFAGDTRGLAFSFCTDGLNPYSHNRVSYSMWSIVLSILNLPRKVRHSFCNLLLVGVVPGNGSKEPNSLDPYLEIVVDELLSLSNRKMFDAY